MFETADYQEGKADRNTPVMLAMPRQAPPIDRTRSVPAHADGTTGVDASFDFHTVLESLLPRIVS
ncbi:hypothetical protein [Streptomyces sp. NPDC096032]|uniref:hypothetical protein n=1 Tax=Streptomyces sp. NPDC096032 TaxID=3366070 RepID=UPI00382E8F9C